MNSSSSPPTKKRKLCNEEMNPMSEGAHECWKHNCLKNFHEFLNRNLFSDVILKVDGVDFPAHKMLLASQSSFFRDLLISEKDVIEVKGVDSETFSVVLDGIYGYASLDLKNVNEVALAAETFGVECFIRECKNFMIKNWEKMDAELASKFSVHFNCKVLKSQLNAQFDYFLGSKSYCSNQFDDTYIIFAFTKSGRPVGDPEMALDNLVSWVAAKRAERIPLLLDIFELYPLAKVSEKFAKDIIDKLCKNMENNIIKCHLLQKLKNARQGLHEIDLDVTFIKCNSALTCHRYNFRSKEWDIFVNSNTGCIATVYRMEDDVYLLGERLFKLNTVTKEILQCVLPHQSKLIFGNNSNLFLKGKTSSAGKEKGVMSKVDLQNPSEWITMKGYDTKLENKFVIATNDKLYFIGLADHSYSETIEDHLESTSCFVYDIKSETYQLACHLFLSVTEPILLLYKSYILILPSTFDKSEDEKTHFQVVHSKSHKVQVHEAYNYPQRQWSDFCLKDAFIFKDVLYLAGCGLRRTQSYNREQEILISSARILENSKKQDLHFSTFSTEVCCPSIESRYSNYFMFIRKKVGKDSHH